MLSWILLFILFNNDNKKLDFPLDSVYFIWVKPVPTILPLTHSTRHIGIAFLAVFMISLVLPTVATAYHFHQLSHQDASSSVWFSDCPTGEAKVISSEEPQSKTKVVHNLPTKPDTDPSLNIPCHASVYLLQTDNISLYQPGPQHLFRHQLVLLHSQLFESRITNPPQFRS